MTTIRTKKFDILVQKYAPATDHLWFCAHYEESMHVNLTKMTIEHEYREIHRDHAGGWMHDKVTKTFRIRRARGLGDWMRAEPGNERQGYNPCPGWIGEVLDAITEYFVIKTIVE